MPAMTVRAGAGQFARAAIMLAVIRTYAQPHRYKSNLNSAKNSMDIAFVLAADVLK